MKRKLTNRSLGLVVILSITSRAENFSAEELNRRTIDRRAVEAVIWGMPAVNYDLMLQQMLTKTNGQINQFLYWSRPLDWKNQTLTPNPRKEILDGTWKFPEAQPVP